MAAEIPFECFNSLDKPGIFKPRNGSKPAPLDIISETVYKRIELCPTVLMFSGGMNIPVFACQQLFEGVLKGDIAQGIAGWVHRTVYVAEPVSKGPHRVWNTGRAKRVDEYHDIVGGPCGCKRHQNGHNGPCDFLLPRG